jgi:hypothetical protein
MKEGLDGELRRGQRAGAIRSRRQIFSLQSGAATGAIRRNTEALVEMSEDDCFMEVAMHHEARYDLEWL